MEGNNTMTRIEFLREQTVSAANKCARTPMPPMDVSEEPLSLPERKALGLKKIFETMPVYIGKRERIVGTRTYYTPTEGNADGHDVFGYTLFAGAKYVNDDDIARFGRNQSYINRTHYTPDFGIVLSRGIDGILADARARLDDAGLMEHQRDFLSAVVIAWEGLKTLILRYADEAERMSCAADDAADRQELSDIAAVCRAVSGGVPKTFHEAVQLLWFAHLGIIVESFEFINYGRLDVLLGQFLFDTPKEEVTQLLACLLLKMYDQADLNITYLGKYAAQLVVTLGGVLPGGGDAVNDVTMAFLDAIDQTRLPEPEFNLRISRKNPPEFLSRAAHLTVTGCNFVSYYNDDLFVESMIGRGLSPEDARSYAFDLCQDINIPGRGDFWVCGHPQLAFLLLRLLDERRDFASFDDLLDAYKALLAEEISATVRRYNEAEAQMTLYARGDYDAYFAGIRRGLPMDRGGNSPMAPLPLLSALFHGSIEQGLDVAFEPYPVKAKGMMFGTVVEAVNALAAIRRTVYDTKRYTLDEIIDACASDFAGEDGRILQAVLLACPKWGNDDDYVDTIAVDVMEFCLGECRKYETSLGGAILGGIHQPHPVPTGAGLGATPDGRHKGAPVAVTLTPESGTMKNGPTAALASAAKLDPMLVQWNMCVMVNYFSSVFSGTENGAGIFEQLLRTYFARGGMQHQPNVTDARELRAAQAEPEKYRDLIVRLWGVSAHFVDLPRNLQDEMIARFEA